MIKPINVYLAGGFRSGWQDKVKEACKDLFDQGLVTWNDPRENNTRDPEVYGPMDRARCELANTCFGYAEKDNPMPFPLFMEMGYMLGRGKSIIFVNELNESDHRYRAYYFAKVFGCEQIPMAENLEIGITALRVHIILLSSLRKYEEVEGKAPIRE